MTVPQTSADTPTALRSPEETITFVDGDHSMTTLQLTPGTLLAERYRIVSLIGRGGMGEVYRADDLKLGQSVALKFLSARGSVDWLFDEVRIGRQISHPNVCRLHDIAEIEGQHCITMEFVDGEDLGSLLRRVGRLSSEKALGVTREICAGLSAAHEKGVVHRDLKPSNIMLDGRGTAKITDFGLAALSSEVQSDFCGTLNYMSPEQLAGGSLSFRSDLYSLGLIIYELFTGQSVFATDSVEQLIAAHQAEKRSPSSVVRDLDIAVERVILACLEEDPAKRPQSARQILAMLPGWDPLAAAVAAGETPSPQIVAAADVASTLSPRAAAMRFGAIVIGLAALLALTPLTMFYAHVPLEKSPEVLADKAQQVATTVGMTTTGLRRYSWFEWDETYVQSPSAVNHSWRDLRTLIPGAMEYVSYWAPAGVAPQNSTGRLQYESPLLLDRLDRVTLDSAGRLKSYRFGDGTNSSLPDRAPPIATLLDLTGLSGATLKLVQDDEWEVRTKGHDPVHIVVSKHSGALLAFAARRSDSVSTDHGLTYVAELGLAPAWGGGALFSLILLSVLIGVGLMIRSKRGGRVDASGALKLAAYIAGVRALSWACGADHSAQLQDEWSLLATGIGTALFAAALTWLFYTALEPQLRRRRPHMLVAWNRLLLGRFRDPLIARDVLTGICVGIAWNLWWRIINLSPELWSLPPLVPYGGVFEAFSSVRGVAFRFFSVQNTAVFFGLGTVFLLTSWQLLTRRPWLSFVGTGALIVLVAYPTLPQARAEHMWFVAAFSAGVAAGLLWIASQFGLLALVMAFFVHLELCAFPLTLDLSSWFAGRSSLGIALLVAVAGWAALTSLEPRRLAAVTDK